MTPGQDARVGPENSCSGLSTISENGLAIPEPQRFAGHVISSRLYCSPKALWKLNWFLRDFGYDAELRERDEVDEKQLVGLWGVIKISHIASTAVPCSDSTVLHSRLGRTFTVNLENPQVVG